MLLPRTLAMMLSMPLLVAECIGFGLVAAYFVSVNLLGTEGLEQWPGVSEPVLASSRNAFAPFIVP